MAFDLEATFGVLKTVAAALVISAVAFCQSPSNITEYPIPTLSSYPDQLAAGPDGALWFTETTGGRVGRITTSGTISEFPLAGGAQPYGIDAGPDGNLWVALSGANAIARVTPSGSLIAFPVPTASSSPFDVTAGPDGNLWFVERTAGRIGRITPAGTITEFPLASASSAPTTITAGPDGALWFAEMTGNAIGRITTAGAVEEYPLPNAGAQPGVIALGPDGNLWVTESARDAVARITTPPAIGPVTAAAKSTSQIDVGVGIGAHAQQTTVSVEYGPTTAYGSTTPVRVFNSLSYALAAQSWSITGLAPGTAYHLRVVATNATGTVRGPDVVATTVAGPVTPGPTAPAKSPAGNAAPATVLTSPLKGPTVGHVAKAPPAATLVGPTTVRVTGGRAPFTVSCPATAVGGCHGTVVLRAATATKKTKATASRCARGCRPLGEAKFDAKAGKRRRVSVKLTATGRGTLAHAAKVKARATVTTVINGKSTTATRTVTLRSR
jgi:streptogramin lyase